MQRETRVILVTARTYSHGAGVAGKTEDAGCCK